jgi:ElaB/YqjD/DUF883 family membrane-anchored ribosome-binding protein
MTRGIAGEGQRQIKALEQRIDQRPLTALLIAAGVGFFGGWLLRR